MDVGVSEDGKKKGRKQLRGEELGARVEAVIRELAEEARSNGKEYIYNASEVARRVPTTRKTLSRHEGVVSRTIGELSSRRRLVNGAAGLEHLRDEVERLKEEITKRDRTILALRVHHVELYTRLHSGSVTGAELVRPVIEKESAEAGRCIICGSDFSERSGEAPGGNVVELPKKDQ